MKKKRFARFDLLPLEDRLTPSGANYLPPSFYFYEQNHPAISSSLPRPGEPLDLARAFLTENAADFDANPSDFANAIVTSQYTDDTSGTTYIYLRQSVNGLPVSSADMSIAVAEDGRIVSAGGGFVPGLAERLAPKTVEPVSTPIQAVEWATAALQVFDNEPSVGCSCMLCVELLNRSTARPGKSETPQAFMASNDVAHTTIIAAGISSDHITAKLQYVPTDDGSAALAWSLIIRTTDGKHWYDMSIADNNGTLVALFDWVNDASYNAVPLPNESPQDGGTSIITTDGLPAASPFGWHDTNGVAGPEFTDTRGNNVDAHLDTNDDDAADASPPRPSGGASLDFSGFVFDSGQASTTLGNQNHAVVNLFYMNNMLHDIHYVYGFTPAAGNFQINNYGLGGSGNDAVQADAQDGGGTDNANFGTPPDGSAPRMQMYLWTNPQRDGDLDNGIIAHEYGHGVSNRLTGGPANSSALNATQSGGMGEGWSDWHALMLTQRPSDTQNGSYGIGTYSLGQSQTGSGIRRYPYSYNMSINPLTFDRYGTGTTSGGFARSTQVHNSGEIWSSALWDMNWLLINKYGFDSDLTSGYTATPGPGNAGNKLAMQLVMDGMKLQPANPSFTQARDAILAADTTLTGGANALEIWTAFARRGLGDLASTASSSATLVNVDFSIPASVNNLAVQTSTPANGSVVSTAPTSFTLNLSAAANAATLQASDLLVNGIAATGFSYTPGSLSVTFTYATTPVTAQGLQTISVVAGSFSRASDGNAVLAYSASFRYDMTVLQVTTTSPTSGSTIAPPMTTLDLNFNEAVLPATVSNSDLVVSGGSVSGFTLLNGNQTIRYTLTGLTAEGTLTASLLAGAFTDQFGNPNLAFSGSYTRDIGTIAYPEALAAANPAGSRVYTSSSSGYIINVAGDIDRFTINLDAGQRITAVITPSSGLIPRMSFTGPGGTNVTTLSAGAGIPRTFNSTPINVAGTYMFSIDSLSNTTGAYTLTLLLNAAPENESIGSTANNTLATAQGLNIAMNSLGNGAAAGAIRGVFDGGASASETEPNGTTATATNAAGTFSTSSSNLYQLSLYGNLETAGDQDYYTIGTLQAGDVITIAQMGGPSGVGTVADTYVYLYRAGASSYVVRNDDSGVHSNGGDSLIYRYTITTADTYYIRAYSYNGGSAGDYTVNAYLENTDTAPATSGSVFTETESNNTKSTANDVASSWRAVQYFSSSSGSISTTTDIDNYAYTFTAGDVITVNARSTSGFDAKVRLMDSTGTVLALEDSTSIGPGLDSPLYAFRIPASGTYYIDVQQANTTTGSYALDVFLSSTTPPPSPLDYYFLNVTAGQSVALSLKADATGGASLDLLDSGGAVVATSIGTTTNHDRYLANFTSPAAGVYYARISGLVAGSYTLTAVTGATLDAEANDTFATAQSLGANLNAIGALAGTDDWFSLNVAAGNTLTLTTATPSDGSGLFTNTLNPRIEVYTPGNALLASDSNSAADGHNATLSVPIGTTGLYRVRVLPESGTSGEYSLAAAVAPTPNAVFQSLSVNGGSSQRSRLTTIDVTFADPVTVGQFAAIPITLTRTAVTPTSTGALTQVVQTGAVGPNGLITVSQLVPGSSTIRLTFSLADGSTTPIDALHFNSLSDGYWQLAIGTGGAVHTSPLNDTNLRILFGNINNDVGVDPTDSGLFSTTFGLSSTDAAFEPGFDFNNDGNIDPTDSNFYSTRFGISF